MDFNTITIHPKIERKSDFVHGQLYSLKYERIFFFYYLNFVNTISFNN